MTAFKLQGHQIFQGLPIAIENRKGSVRKGVDRDGKPWRTEMKFPYGYIKGTKGVDGDEVDVYVGPDKKAPEAYVVHQHKADGKGFDEDKVMLGFASTEAARKAYLAHYNSPKFLGPMEGFSIETLRKMLKTHEGKKLTEKTASPWQAFMADFLKLASFWDTATGGHSPATLQALAARNQQPNFANLRQQWDQNSQHALQRTDVVGQQVPAIRESLGKSDSQIEHEWQQRLLAKKEEAAQAANAAMPATGAHSPAALRGQAPAAAPMPGSGIRPKAPIVPMLPSAPQLAGRLTPKPMTPAPAPVTPRAPAGVLGSPVAKAPPALRALPRLTPMKSALGGSAPLKGLLGKFASALKAAAPRYVQEYLKASPEGQAEIAQASGRLGLKPRYVGDISEGGQEAGVDKMIGAGHVPGTVPDQTPRSIRQRLEDYRAQKAKLGLEGRSPSPSVMQSPVGRGVLGVQAPASAPAAVPGQNESGLLARKMYKPDSLLHRAEFTPQVLQQKQEFTDAARAISPEAKAMVPAMYGHQVLHADKGPELQRATSLHEFVPGMKEFQKGDDASRAALEDVHKTVLAPMEKNKMVLGDTISRRGVNYGNVVSSPQGPKVVDFLPSDRRTAGTPSPMISSREKYTPTGENSLFHEKAQLPLLRREVFKPQLQVKPGGALQGALPASPLNKVLHPGASFISSGTRPRMPKIPAMLGKVAEVFLPALEDMFHTGQIDHEFLAKVAFQQSQYGSTGGFVDFNQTSDVPPLRVPDMTKKVVNKKLASLGLPKSTLYTKPRLKAPGPSIAQQYKPKGFGRPLEGATQGAM